MIAYQQPSLFHLRFVNSLYNFPIKNYLNYIFKIHSMMLIDEHFLANDYTKMVKVTWRLTEDSLLNALVWVILMHQQTFIYGFKMCPVQRYLIVSLKIQYVTNLYIFKPLNIIFHIMLIQRNKNALFDSKARHYNQQILQER